MNLTRVQLCHTLSLLLVWATAAGAQQLAGNYSGVLGTVTVKLNIAAAQGGGYKATLDSPMQHAFGLACTDVQMNGQAISFQVPSVKGTFSGVISADGSTMAGLWTQAGGSPMALNFTRDGGAGNGAAPGGAPASQNSGPPASSDLSASSCTTPQNIELGLGARYWDGSAWQPMTASNRTIDAERFDAGAVLRDPLHMKNIYTFQGPAAPTTLGASPKFCLYIPMTVQPNFLIAILDIRRGNRQIEVLKPTYQNGSLSELISPHKQRPLTFQRVSDTYVVATPAEPLPSGQYLLMNSQFGTLDFGVQ